MKKKEADLKKTKKQLKDKDKDITGLKKDIKALKESNSNLTKEKKAMVKDKDKKPGPTFQEAVAKLKKQVDAKDYKIRKLEYDLKEIQKEQKSNRSPRGRSKPAASSSKS